jgi:hypothetical protein
MFENERLSSGAVISFEKTILGIIGVTAATCIASPFLFKSDRTLTGMLLGAGTASSALFAIVARTIEGKEPLYKSLKEADNKALKQSLTGEAVKNHVITEIETQREIAAYVNTLPSQERPRWIEKYSLHGLVVLPAPPAARQSAPSPSGIPTPDIADINEDDVQSVVNPGVMARLKAIASNNPKYVRLDGVWIDELCDAASLGNMSDRSNHHFYLAGGTQSGKSTLAGVIINKIAAKSNGASAVVGSDPKDGVTRWLCKFSRKFDGMESLEQWIAFATSLVDKRKDAIASSGVGNMPELFLLQDEVDSVFGGGKGFPGKVDKSTAASLQALWNYIIKFTAGLRCHGVFMGQSPLSGATGFSRPDLKNLCFIAMGQTSSYILDNPKDFINAKPEVLEVLQFTCELLDEARVRYALVVPTRSNPFVALIPEFDIEGLEQRQDKRDSESDWYEKIKKWVSELELAPTSVEVKTKWQELTGRELNEKGVQMLMETLGL